MVESAHWYSILHVMAAMGADYLSILHHVWLAGWLSASYYHNVNISVICTMQLMHKCYNNIEIL